MPDDETPAAPPPPSSPLAELAELRAQWEALAAEPLTGLPREALVASIHDLAGELLARTPDPVAEPLCEALWWTPRDPAAGVQECYALELIDGPKPYLRIWPDAKGTAAALDWGYRLHESAVLLWSMTTLPATSKPASGGPPPAEEAPPPGQLYLIWSNEHRGFWRPHEHGYTPVMEWAGLYTEDQVRAVMQKSTLGEPVDAHDPLGVFEDAHVAREVPIPVTVHPGGSACPPPGYRRGL